MDDSFIVFDLLDNGDKVFVSEFKTYDEAVASLDESKLQSIEEVTLMGKQIRF